MIIDMHTHLFMGGDMPKEHLKATARRWAYARKPFRDPNDVLPRIMPGLTDADGSLFFADMTAFGIDTSVSHVLDYQWGLQSEQDTPIDELNRRYGELQRTHPGRFYAFAGVDHRRPDAMDLFERAIKEYDLRGYKIYPATGFDPSDPALEPFFRRCVETRDVHHIIQSQIVNKDARKTQRSLGVRVYASSGTSPGRPGLWFPKTPSRRNPTRGNRRNQFNSSST